MASALGAGTIYGFVIASGDSEQIAKATFGSSPAGPVVALLTVAVTPKPRGASHGGADVPPKRRPLP